jgi:hypothetical protein
MMGTPSDVMLLAVPTALFAIAGLLFLASHLEQRRTSVLVRLAVRTKRTTPEIAEAVIASELAPLLARSGLLRDDAA